MTRAQPASAGRSQHARASLDIAWQLLNIERLRALTRVLSMIESEFW